MEMLTARSTVSLTLRMRSPDLSLPTLAAAPSGVTWTTKTQQVKGDGRLGSHSLIPAPDVSREQCATADTRQPPPLVCTMSVQE